MFDDLISWQLGVGLVLGFALSRLWCLAKVWWLDRRRPLPGNRHRSRWDALAINGRAIGAVIGAAFIVWSVVTTQGNTNESHRITTDAREFAAEVQRCQGLLIEAIIGSRAVTADNDRLSRDERTLLAEGQQAQAEWLRDALINPPPNIATLPLNHPERQIYGLAVTRAYFQRVEDINRRIAGVHDEQSRNDGARPPLPDPDCGR